MMNTTTYVILSLQLLLFFVSSDQKKVTSTGLIDQQRKVAAATVTAPAYSNRLGECEAFTIEFIAGLVTKKARQLLQQPFAAAIKRGERRSVRFDLYTHYNSRHREELRTDDYQLLAASHFNSSWPVRFSIHGWNGQVTTCSNAAIKDAYLTKGNYNVILVDWSDYALDINYFKVITDLFTIADQINQFARFLHRVANIEYENIYLIGHSLGCHLAGIAGKRLWKPHKYGVIFALDSAGPVLGKMNTTWRLAPTDALYVESIQTDLSFFGYRGTDLAHATFFPNWGLGQPHCPNVTAMEPDFVCDHFGALYYFVDSLILERSFGGYKCDNFNSIVQQTCGCGRRQCTANGYMGGDPAISKNGIYYLSTRNVQPFGYGNICHMKRPLNPTTIRLAM